MSSVLVKNLVQHYGAVEVLHSLNLDVQAGEFLVLLGPSGCGKSTLLNCIAGLDEITAGQVFIDDKNVTWAEPKDRGIGMVFQSYALYPHMSVEQNWSFGLRAAGVPKREIHRRTAHAADILQLQALLKRKPATLSGGQRQRVAIGRALVRDVSVYLFDEPLSNLDAKLRTDLRLELKRLHQQLGTTMIYVTHDQVEALTLADRVAVMQDGIIQQLDTPQQIYSQPNNRFVAEFVGSPTMNFIDGSIARLNNEWVFAGQGLQLALPEYTFMHTPKQNQQATLGIRAEHLQVGVDAADASTQLELSIELVELMGPDQLLRGNCNGQSLSVRTAAATHAQSGESIIVGLSAEHVSLFDENHVRI
jgi:multiple sugar transport system ATP-binding protein